MYLRRAPRLLAIAFHLSAVSLDKPRRSAKAFALYARSSCDGTSDEHRRRASIEQPHDDARLLADLHPFADLQPLEKFEL